MYFQDPVAFKLKTKLKNSGTRSASPRMMEVRKKLKVGKCATTGTAADAIRRVSDGNTDEALARGIRDFRNVRTASQLNTILISAGSRAETLARGGAGRGKIRVQPTSVSRRAEGQPRGAARLAQGRRPSALPEKPPKLWWRSACWKSSSAAWRHGQRRSGQHPHRGAFGS